MSTDGTEQQQQPGCFPLVRILLIVLWSIIIIVILTHKPIDYFRLVGSTVYFAICLVIFSPWLKSIVPRHPRIAMILPLIAIFITIYPLFVHPSSDNSFERFLILVSSPILLFIMSPWLRYVLRWFPFFIAALIILLTGLDIIYHITHPPIDFFRLLSVFIVSVALLLFMLLYVGLLRRWMTRGKTTKEVTLRLGQADPPQATERPTTHLRFLGLSVKIYRDGRRTCITLSSE